VMVLRSLSGATLRAIGQITVEFHSDPVFGFDLRRDVEKYPLSASGTGSCAWTSPHVPSRCAFCDVYHRIRGCSA